MGYPTDREKEHVLDLYLDRFGVAERLTRRRLQMILTRDFARLQIVPAHIEEFVKAGVKRDRLRAPRRPNIPTLNPGSSSTKSVALPKQQPGGVLVEALAMLQKLELAERPAATGDGFRPDAAKTAAAPPEPRDVPKAASAHSDWREVARVAASKMP